MENKINKGEIIGEFLLRINAITEAQLKSVLEEQAANPDKLFGEIAIDRGYINDEALDEYIKAKYNSNIG